VNGLPLGKLPVGVRARGVAPLRAELDVFAGDATPPELVLEPGAVVVGTVRDAAGAPIAGAEVATDEPNTFRGARVHSGNDGSFRLEGLATGEQVLNATKGSLRRAQRLAPAAGIETSWDPVLAPDAGYVVRGRVLDHRGEPWRRARVTLQDSRSQRSAMTSTIAGEDGCFHQVVPWERVSIGISPSLQLSGFPLLVEDDVAADGSEIVLRAPDPALTTATIRGAVMDEEGRPLFAKVHVWHETARMWRGFNSDAADGSFVIERVPPGQCTVDVRAADRPWFHAGTLEVAGGAILDLGALRVAAGGRIEAAVRLRDGTAPGELKVSVMKDNREAGVAEAADGRLWTGPLAAGEHVLVLTGDRIATRYVRADVQSGATTALEIELDRAALRVLRFRFTKPPPDWYSVHVIDATGRAVFGGSPAWNGPQHEVRASVPAGDLTVLLYGPGGRELQRWPLAVDGLADAPPVTLVVD
jgi:hypothetical protein